MKAVSCLLLVAAASATVVQEGPMLPASEKAFDAWMASGGEELTGKETMNDFRLKVTKRAAAWLQDQLKDVPSIYRAMTYLGMTNGVDVSELETDLEKMSRADSTAEFIKVTKEAAEKMDKSLKKDRTPSEPLGDDEYPYFNFLPQSKGNVLPDGPALEWSNSNCRKNKATAKWNENKSGVVLEVESSDCGVFHYGDFYLFATTEGVHPQAINDLSKKHTINWRLVEPNNTAVIYDFTKKGIRVLAFHHDEATTMKNLLATTELFLQPDVGRYPVKPDEKVTAKNIDFLTKYRPIQPFITARADTTPVEIDQDLVGTGDFVGVIRLDGLDPMLGWAMGSTTGHTTVAMRNSTNDLHICESTGVTDYWPVNGVQCTPWNVWIDRAVKAGFQVTWAPLAPEWRAKLDQDKMWEFFSTVDGLDYGFENMLWGWIDTVAGNYPCVAPDFTSCCTWEIIELLFTIGHRYIPGTSDRLISQAWNLRMGTRGLTPDEILMHAETVLNISTADIPAMVEKDEWMYNTTKFGKPATGPSMVCCVFVCHMWKAGGLFGDDDINCGELSNLDDYSLNIFNPALANENRPDVCKKADPNNQLCQLVGDHTLNFNHFNESGFYPHMDERCPTWAPGTGPEYWGPGKQDMTC